MKAVRINDRGSVAARVIDKVLREIHAPRKMDSLQQPPTDVLPHSLGSIPAVTFRTTKFRQSTQTTRVSGRHSIEVPTLPEHPKISMSAKTRKSPKPTVLRDFFNSLDEGTKGLLLLAMNLETGPEQSLKVKQDKLEAEILRRTK